MMDKFAIELKIWPKVLLFRQTSKYFGRNLTKKSMIIQQGGSLELADRPQGGYHTTFVVQLP